jgi:hypothetical protein
MKRLACRKCWVDITGYYYFRYDGMCQACGTEEEKRIGKPLNVK